MVEQKESAIKTILLTRDSLYSRLFINEILRSKNVDVVGILFSTTYLKRNSNPIVDLVSFVFRVGLSYALYQSYVSWILPWLKGVSSIDGVPILKSGDINSTHSLGWLQSLKPEVLLSFHFNQKLLDPAVRVPSKGALNFHPSYLPSWRGVDPVLFALQNDSSILGGSIHWIAPEIDEGDILLREKLGKEHVAGLIKTNEALFTLGGRMAGEVIGDLVNFERQRLLQADLGLGHYDGWCAVSQLGLKGLLKALWAKPRKLS